MGERQIFAVQTTSIALSGRLKNFIATSPLAVAFEYKLPAFPVPWLTGRGIPAKSEEKFYFP
jgi:hypothetical protein